MDADRKCWGLLRRGSCLAPTWRGLLALLLGLALLLVLALRGVYPFLALNDPKPGGVLLIQGWAPDSVLKGCVAEFNRHHYDKVFVTGGPVEQGGPLCADRNYADMCAGALLRLGMNSNVVQSVPAAGVRPDRTLASAVAVKRWGRAHGMTPTNMNLLAVGPAARLARLHFKRVFGREVTVGVVAFSPEAYDGRRWWRSSEGFRTVTREFIGYCYALFTTENP